LGKYARIFENMARGGARVGAGRPAGSKARGIRITDRMLAKVQLSDTANPLQYMLAVMQDDKQKPSLRMQAAIAAAPYVHPKLSSVEVKGDNDKPLQIQSDLGQALAALADMARQRDGQIIELLPSEVEEIEA
jgi:hypothetical protein